MLKLQIKSALIVVFGWSLLASSSAKADTVGDLLGNRLLCAIAGLDRADMEIAPISASVPFERTSMQEFCDAATDRDELGNGLDIKDGVWTLNPGNRLDIGARSLRSVALPYMQRLVYRQVQTERGVCELEMRVYKKSPGSEGERSLIALHGGSWTGRTFGFLGLESNIPHFVDQGFVVYAPFYRLLGSSDSSAACNQSDLPSIVEDGEAALRWVIDNASRFGSSGNPVVYGQSAGAHLALSMSVNQPSLVSGAVLMYPPTDFTDFLLRARSGAYTDSEGLSVLTRVVGTAPEDTSLSLPIVLDNSYPQRIATEGGDWPPMFMIHGTDDTLVEARQSALLCDALAGREIGGAGIFVEEPRLILSCGTDTSQLHLIKDARHALDVCIDDRSNIDSLCFSGSGTGRSLVSNSIKEAVSFSVNAHQSDIDDIAREQAAAEQAARERAAAEQAARERAAAEQAAREQAAIEQIAQEQAAQQQAAINPVQLDDVQASPDRVGTGVSGLFSLLVLLFFQKRGQDS